MTLKKKDYNRAKEYYEKELETSPAWENKIRHNLGLTYILRDDYDNALSEYRKAIEFSQKYWSSKYLDAALHNDIGLIYKCKGDIENAIKEYNISIDIYPEFTLPYYNLGLLYRQTNNLVNAKSQFEKVISLDEHFYPVYLELGDLLYDKKEYISAKNYFEKAISIDATDIIPKIQLAAVLLNLGKYNEIEDLMNYIENKPEIDINLAIKRLVQMVRDMSKKLQVSNGETDESDLQELKYELQRSTELTITTIKDSLSEILIPILRRTIKVSKQEMKEAIEQKAKELIKNRKEGFQTDFKLVLKGNNKNGGILIIDNDKSVELGSKEFQLCLSFVNKSFNDKENSLPNIGKGYIRLEEIKEQVDGWLSEKMVSVWYELKELINSTSEKEQEEYFQKIYTNIKYEEFKIIMEQHDKSKGRKQYLEYTDDHTVIQAIYTIKLKLEKNNVHNLIENTNKSYRFSTHPINIDLILK